MHQRYDNLIPKRCKVLLGPKYAILRSEFTYHRKDIKIVNEDINLCIYFFSLSTDQFNLTETTLVFDH